MNDVPDEVLLSFKERMAGWTSMWLAGLSHGRGPRGGQVGQDSWKMLRYMAGKGLPEMRDECEFRIAILTASGFTDVSITGVHEPVYYGPDVATALRAMLSLQMTKDLLAPLDATRTEHTLGRLRAALATHHSSDGVFFDSRAWLITAHRPMNGHFGTA